MRAVGSGASRDRARVKRTFVTPATAQFQRYDVKLDLTPLIEQGGVNVT